MEHDPVSHMPEASAAPALRGSAFSGLLLVVLFALLLRAGWVLYSWSISGAQLPYDDERLHWQLATNLHDRGAFVSDDGRFAPRMPAYPGLLWLFAGLGDSGVLAARLAQAAIGAIGVWLAGAWTRRAFGARAGLLAAVLCAVDPFQVFAANLLLNEVLFSAIALGLAFSAWRVLRRSGFDALGFLLTSALGGLAIYTRPEALGWVLLLWLLMAGYQRDTPHAARLLALHAVALLVMLGPWAMRNLTVFGTPLWLSANGGVTLYDGLGPQADGSSDQSFLYTMPELARLDEVQRDRYLAQAAAQQAYADPGRAAALALHKFMRMWNPTPNVEAHQRGFSAWASRIFTIGTLGLALLGLLRHLGQRAWTSVVVLPIVYFTLIGCIFIGSVRYRVPLMPFLCVAGAALVQRAATGAVAQPASGKPGT